MKDLLTDFFAGCVFFTAIGVIIYSIADGVMFTRAGMRALKDGRSDEWFEQPNLMALGSGFRLFRHFCRKP